MSRIRLSYTSRKKLQIDYIYVPIFLNLSTEFTGTKRWLAQKTDWGLKIAVADCSGEISDSSTGGVLGPDGVI